MRIAIPMSNISSNIGDPLFPLILKQWSIFKNISIVLNLYQNLLIKTPQNKSICIRNLFYFSYDIRNKLYFPKILLKRLEHGKPFL